jgi:multidrug efflux pump subunit AcrA (membrane-fusion protein)
VTIPASAVFERAGKQQVWIVNAALKTVALREMFISAGHGATTAVTAGIEPGDRVVTAGVHSLEPAQSIKIPEEAQMSTVALGLFGSQENLLARIPTSWYVM